MKTRKLAIIILAGLAISLAGMRNAPAVTVTWDWAGGLDHNNFTYTTNSNVTLTDTAGVLQLTKPASSSGGTVQGGYIDSKFKLHGDFDVQLDYTINSPPLNRGVQIQLNLASSPFFAMVRSMEANQNYHVWQDPPAGWHGSTSTGDNSGALRAARVGGTAYFYFADASQPSGWRQIYTSGINTGDITFSFCSQDNLGVNPTPVLFDVSFDNLVVTAEALPNYVPLPGAAWLLGSGLLGLAGWRLRKR